MSGPLKVQIVERARALIADEQHWCRGHLAQDENGVAVFRRLRTQLSGVVWAQ
ncbi:MAG TPA: hypothetical protein VNS88_05135 [Nitrospiraceae bacterium]|nr:hypothetical protein [Nitrospiraceae bacterium]